MNASKGSIGFDRDIQLEWLDYAAAQVAAGKEPQHVRDALWARLEGVVAGDESRSARDKTITVLMKIWSDVPEGRIPMRRTALELVGVSTPQTRLAIQWSMSMAAYPFFAEVVTTTGRLLQLQGSTSLNQITRRMVELRGDRSTMIRATRRVVRSIVRWGALADTNAKGDYVATKEKTVVAGKLGSLLGEGLLQSGIQRAIAINEFKTHPSMFPFELAINSEDIRKSPNLELRQDPLSGAVFTLRHPA